VRGTKKDGVQRGKKEKDMGKRVKGGGKRDRGMDWGGILVRGGRGEGKR